MIRITSLDEQLTFSEMVLNNIMWKFYCISTFSLISEAFVQERFLVTKIGFNLGLIDEEVGTLRINISHPNKIF